MKTTDRHLHKTIRYAIGCLLAGFILWLLFGCTIQRNYKDSDPFRDSDTVYQARMGGLWEYDSIWTKVDTVK